MIASAASGFCQGENQFSRDIKFAGYLNEQREYSDAIYFMKKMIRSAEAAGGAQSDSLNYYLGWAYYSNKSLDTSVTYFSSISSGSAFFSKSKFYQAYLLNYRNRPAESKSLLNNFDTGTDTGFTKLKNFDLAGIALLQRDMAGFDSLSKNFDPDFYPLHDEQINLRNYALGLRKIKKKSPVVAGLMSALIPGSGKAYAGYKLQGLAAFITCSLFGISAAESYLKTKNANYRNARCAVFGSIFAIFYVGNIWGSALSVKIKREERFNETDRKILVDLHVPLRRIFK